MKKAILLSPDASSGSAPTSDAPASDSSQAETPAAILLKKARIEPAPDWMDEAAFMSKIKVGLTTEQSLSVMQLQHEFDATSHK